MLPDYISSVHGVLLPHCIHIHDRGIATRATRSAAHAARATHATRGAGHAARAAWPAPLVAWMALAAWALATLSGGISSTLDNTPSLWHGKRQNRLLCSTSYAAKYYRVRGYPETRILFTNVGYVLAQTITNTSDYVFCAARVIPEFWDPTLPCWIKPWTFVNFCQ